MLQGCPPFEQLAYWRVIGWICTMRRCQKTFQATFHRQQSSSVKLVRLAERSNDSPFSAS
jgi:hypothetical protein